MAGFKYYDTPTATARDFKKYVRDEMTDAQRAAVLQAYTDREDITTAKFKLHLDRETLSLLYEYFKEIEDYAIRAARGEVEGVDAATVTATKSAFNTHLRQTFQPYLPISYTTDVANQMYVYAKRDGSGTYAYWLKEVTAEPTM